MSDGVLVRAADDAVGGMVLIHGQGDHSMRHLRTVEALASRGVTIVAPDLPGHGASPGRRGHIPGVHAIDEAIASAVRRLRELVPGKPIGIAGHSMGGLMVMDHFARGKGGDFRWAWLSSTLVEASHGKPVWLQRLGRAVAKFWPSFTISTGVRPKDLVEGGADPDLVARERASGTHNRISVGWGMELLRSSRRVDRAADHLFGDRPVLLTHGDDDSVCPIGYARALFERLPSPDKEFVVIPGGKHEPWHGAELIGKICDWTATRASQAGASSAEV